MPPVKVDGRVLVAGAHQDPEYVVGYLGSYRIMISDLILLTMAEEPMADDDKVRDLVRRIKELRPELPVLPTVFRPRPVGDVSGMRVAYVSTAPGAVLEKLAGHLEDQYGCEVVASSGSLSDRKRLERDLDAMPPVDAYLTEIKAAAVDVVTRRGAEEERPVVYCDNEPVGEGLDGELLRLARSAMAGSDAGNREPGIENRKGW